MGKDDLEKLLEEEMGDWEEEVKKLEKQIPDSDEEEKEDDELDNDEEKDDDNDDDEKDTGGDVTIEKLQAQLEQLERDRRGLYKELKSERRTRQEMGEQINTFQQTLNQIIQQRQAAPKSAEPTERKFKGIPLEFTEDGDAYIPEDKLAELSKPLQERIENLQKSMQSTTGQIEEAAKAQAAIDKVLSEDERFPQVWPTYQKARRWVNDQVIEWQKDNGIGGFISSSDALAYVFDEDLQSDFQKKFPNVDLERIVTAEDGDYFLKKTLRSLADSVSSEDEEQLPPTRKAKDERFEKVLKKPTGLGGSADQKRGEKSVLETAEALSSLDVLELSDAQADALLRALEREEKVNGITFN